MADLETQKKWDRAASSFDLMASKGPEKRWLPHKEKLFANMQGNILFLALGTGLDIPAFPPGRTIQAIDISPGMLEQAQARIAEYQGSLTAKVMDVHDLDFTDGQFDQVFTSCTFCSVPRPVEGLKSLLRVLRPGGELYMFEHTGSRFFPISLMMKIMTKLTEKIGPSMDRQTTDNVRKAGFEIIEIENIFLDVVKVIKARKPA